MLTRHIRYNTLYTIHILHAHTLYVIDQAGLARRSAQRLEIPLLHER